jgi:hypothetical protein
LERWRRTPVQPESAMREGAEKDEITRLQAVIANMTDGRQLS